MKTKGLTLLLFLALSCQNRPQQGIVVKDLLSPDGKMKMEFLLTADGTPQYSLSYEGSQVVLPSDLGFELRGTVKASKLVFGDRMEKVDEQEPYSLHDDFEVIGSSTDTFDETWAPVWGEESVIRNHYNELLVNLKQKGTGNKMDIRFRLYDDGLGFRYEFPGIQPLNYFVIKEELTNFVMADDCTAWWIPGDFDTQEYEYTESRLSEISQHLEAAVCGNSSQTLFSMSGVQTSLLMRTDEGLFVSIHEAALVDYPCMHLNVDEKTHTLTSFLTPDAQGWKGPSEYFREDDPQQLQRNGFHPLESRQGPHTGAHQGTAFHSIERYPGIQGIRGNLQNGRFHSREGCAHRRDVSRTRIP